jgi:hypothetical protein
MCRLRIYIRFSNGFKFHHALLCIGINISCTNLIERRALPPSIGWEKGEQPKFKYSNDDEARGNIDLESPPKQSANCVRFGGTPPEYAVSDACVGEGFRGLPRFIKVYCNVQSFCFTWYLQRIYFLLFREPLNKFLDPLIKNTFPQISESQTR